MSVTIAYEFYRDLGMVAIPVKSRSKMPMHSGWQKFQNADSDRLFEGRPEANIGVLLGKPSGNLSDVDLDTPAAVALAPFILPPTGFVFGRASKRASHHFYRVDRCEGGVRFTHPVTGEVMEEIREDRQFTVVPGSIHPSGEAIEFEGDPDELAVVRRSDLLLRCSLIAVAQVVGEAWNKGQRHNLAMAISGVLAFCEVSRENAIRVVTAIANWKNDDEVEDRLLTVETTYDRHEAGLPVASWTALREYLDPKVIKAISKWLGKDHSSPGSTPPGADTTSSDRRTSLETMGTDIGAATAFAAAMDGELKFADDTQRWFRKKKGVYGAVTNEQVIGEAIDYVERLEGESERSEAERRILQGLKASARIRAMVDLSKSRLRHRQSDFDKDPWLVGCDTGVLDLRERCIVETDTVVTRKVGSYFDPDAKCPSFMRFVNEVFDGDEEVVRFVQRAFGYTLTGRTTEQCLFVCIGSGSNGKSTLSGVMYNLLKDYAASVPMHTLMQSRFGNEKTDDLAMLKGVRFASAQEGERGAKLAEARIKLMTGSDPIVCRQLYKTYEEYVPHFKLWLSTNDLPEINGTDEAIWRRIHVIPFPVTFSSDRKDPDLKDKLIKELPGILNWVLDGLVMWNEEGLNAPETIRRATERYRGESDIVSQFVQMRCVLDPEAKTSLAALYEAYKTWCVSSGFDPTSNIQFGKEMNRLGFENYKSNVGMGRKGIRLMS